MTTSADVEAQLTQAVAGESDSSTDAQEKVTSTEAKTDDGTVPRSRLNEVSTKFKEASSAWEAEKAEIGTKLEQAQARATELAEAVAKSREDTELVASLKQLARNPAHTDLIAKVDAALAGEDYSDDTSTEEDAQDDSGTPDRKSIMKEIRGEMESALEEQRHEVLLQQTDLIAKDAMRQLPADKYSEADKEIIAELWSNKVDWDEISATPKELGNILSRSLQETLDRFDQIKPAPVETGNGGENKENSTTEEPSVEEQIGQILGKPWGATKEVDGKNVAEISEGEFDSAFGNLFKKLNELNN